MDFPKAHRKQLASTNPLERVKAETGLFVIGECAVYLRSTSPMTAAERLGILTSIDHALAPCGVTFG
jgi:hypothetical protein